MKKSALFRKVAPAIWTDSGDPSVYGFFELDVTDVKDRSMILPLFIKAVIETLAKNPMMTTMVRWGRIVQRKDKSISVMVNIPGAVNDLSALHITSHDHLSLEQIRDLLDSKAHLIRKDTDPHLGPLLKIVGWLPHWLIRLFISVYLFLIYDLNHNLGLGFLPLRPFGSVIVSNVGSLGLSKALLPLVPLAGASVMLSLGEIKDEVKAINGNPVIRTVVDIGVTFDHRLFDGSHAAKMLKDFKASFQKAAG